MLSLGRVEPGYRRALWIGAVGCIAAALIGQFRFGNSLYLYTDIKNKPGAFQGSMTAVSGFLLVIAAVFAFRIHEVLRRQQDIAARSFLGASALLAFLAYDEVAMFHEWFAAKCEQWEIWKPLGIDQDIYVFAVYGLIALVLARRLVPVALRHRDPWPLGVLMVLFAVGSEIVDFIPWESLTAGEQTWLGPLEEGLKTMATLAATLGAHALLDGIERTERNKAAA